jgi:hypothetical protein
MTELLIIKSGEEYYRFSPDGFEECGLNKASVFSVSQLEKAKSSCKILAEAGIKGQLMKLTIREELFYEDLNE